jgi:hypothetical protein
MFISQWIEDEADAATTHVDLEHLLKVGNRVDHVVRPLLLDGDSSAMNTSRKLSVTQLELLGEMLLSRVKSLYRAR